MILIKDRHNGSSPFSKNLKVGKYDTYKGSTPLDKHMISSVVVLGKYDTYKGSTHTK